MSAPRRPRVPGRSRAATLERLRRELLDTGRQSLALTRRGTEDPTVALLDAWATVTDVLSFYEDRIRDEGFLDTAVEDSSVLGLLELTGVRPRPGVGAGVLLAYLLHDDPDDALVELPARLLAQSVPGPGEEMQTFETSTSLRARPSWSTLGLRTGRPVSELSLDGGVEALWVRGTASGVAVGDHLLWRHSDQDTPLQVVDLSTDPEADTTRLGVARTPQRADGPHPDDGSPVETDLTSEPWSPVAVLESLSRRLVESPRAGDVAGRASDPAQDSSWSESFAADSDALPRLIESLHPEVSTDLYAALATSRRPTPAGPPVLSALRVSATPFGVAAPPRPVFDEAGRPGATAEWPLEDTVDLRIRLTGPRAELSALREGDLTPDNESWLTDQIVKFLRSGVRRHRGLLSVFGVGAALDKQLADAGERIQRGDLDRLLREQGEQGGKGEQGGQQQPGETDGGDSREPPVVIPSRLLASVTAQAPGRPVQHRVVTMRDAPSVSLGPLGTLGVAPDEDDLLVTYDSGEIKGAGFEARVSFEQSDESVTFTIGPDSAVWYPAAGKPTFSAVLGARQMGIVLEDSADELTITLKLPMPTSQPGVLHLDRAYPQIVPGSRILLTCPDDAQPPGALRYPVVRRVLAVETVATVRYGMSADVTRLVLDDRWVDQATSLGQVRKIRVHAAPLDLTLLPRPFADDLAGDRLELSALHRGLEAGRPLVVTGERTDLPGGATTSGGELIEVRSVGVAATPGGTPYSTVTLRRPMQHSYRRSSVTVHGNVVAAHQAATVTEVLGSGDPSVAHQQFTLSEAPVLAETTPLGVTSTLVVHVGGRRYDEVSRLGADTPVTSYLIALDGRGHTTLTFAAPLPAGSGNVVATYRAGWGSQGNVRAGQVSQLLTRPLAVTGVTNPLAASGGADPESAHSLRERAGTGLRALDRAVSLEDYRDLALDWAGVGKATATRGHDGHGRATVVVDVAGATPAPLGPESPLVAGLRDRLVGPEPTIDVTVRAVEPLTVFVLFRVARDPDWTWDAVAAAVRQSLAEDLGYAARTIGQDVLVADLLVSAQSPAGVVAATVAGLTLVPPAESTAGLTGLADRLRRPVPSRTRVGPSQLAFVDPKVTRSILLEEEPW